MPKVEIEPATRVTRSGYETPQRAGGEGHPEPLGWVPQQLEQHLGGSAIEDSPKPRMLDDGLRLRREMFEISKADAVDARRLPAGPATPDQPAGVEQQRRVVGQRRS
jgi:hypothetical protein